MHNASKPTLEELPSSAQLLKSTITAALAAAVILVTTVLPAEYGVDPTRVGRLLGLKQMGEIKQQLASEAESHAAAFTLTPSAGWKDEVTLTLTPGQGAEIKLVMKQGAVAEFEWAASGGVVNFDLHGDDVGGNLISYESARGVPGHRGTLTAAFDGNHGWYWRNRDSQPVTITLRVLGDYAEVNRTG